MQAYSWGSIAISNEAPVFILLALALPVKYGANILPCLIQMQGPHTFPLCVPISTRIGEYQNQHVLAIISFDNVDCIVRGATRIGIVGPMQNDQFTVVRFSLAGSTYAIDRMREAAQAKMQRAPRNTGKLPPEERL